MVWIDFIKNNIQNSHATDNLGISLVFCGICNSKKNSSKVRGILLKRVNDIEIKRTKK